MKKRILALLTAVMMFSSVVPTFAAELSPEPVDGYQEVFAGQDLESFISLNHPTSPTPTASSGIYTGKKFLGGLAAGRGAVYANMDFGDGADELILDVKMAIPSNYDTTSNHLSFRVFDGPVITKEYNCTDANHLHPAGGINFTILDDLWVGLNATEVAQAKGIKTNGWEDFQIRHYAVANPSQLKGVRNVAMFAQNGSPFNNVYSFQFNKPVSPYKALLTDEEITSEEGKEIKSLDFDSLGADKVTLTYNEGATGTVSIYKDTIGGSYTSSNYLLDTITLDGTGSQVVNLNKDKYTGYADLYFEVTDGVALSQVEFNEYKTNDAYAEVVVARDFDAFVSFNHPNLANAGSGIYAGQKYFGGLTGGKGAVFKDMDFGEGADEMILDVKMALPQNYNPESELVFKIVKDGVVTKVIDCPNTDGSHIAHDNQITVLNDYNDAFNAKVELARIQGIKTNGWEEFQIRHYPVNNVAELTGVKNITVFVQSGSRYSNVYSFQFNKAVSPFQTLLADDVITSAKGKEIKSLDFNDLGADKVTLTYNEGATGTVSIYKDSINGSYKSSGYLHESITLDGSGNQTVNLDREKYKGYADFYFEVTGEAQLSQIEFSEYEVPDNFDRKLEIKATYIGNGEWSAETKAAFEEKNAYPGRTFTDTYYNLQGMTDMQYLDFLSTDFSDADVIFVQANNRAEGILDALVNQKSDAVAIVIGNASYAKAYGVAAVSNDAFGLPETYNVPTYMIHDEPYTKINTIDFDEVGGPTLPKQEGDKNHTQSWGKNSYAVFNSYRFTMGIKEVKLEHAHKKNGGSMRISLDGKENGTLVADFLSLPTTPDSYGPPYTTTTTNAITSVNGVHDIYAYVYSDSFANLSTIQFVPYEKITKQVGMNAYNMDWAAPSVEYAFDTFNNFGAEDTVEYVVDFGDMNFKKNFVVNAAAENANGKIVLKIGDVQIAEFDLRGANGNFQSIETVSEVPLTGVQTITLAYEGAGECSVKDISFSDYITLDSTFDYSNYSETSGSKNAAGYIGGLGNGNPGAVNYVKWSNVSFDGENKLWNLTLEYAIPSKYAGSQVTVYADKIGGPVIATAILVNQSNMGWEAFKTVTVPVTYLPEGTHDLYITVTRSDYTATDMALNLKGMKFSRYTGDEKFRVDYRTIAKGEETNPLTVNATLTFIKDETTPANYIFAAAIYDKTTKQLVDVKPIFGTTVEGLNTASIVYNYADVAGYEYKYFVWDGTTLKPLQAQAFSTEF